MASPSGKAYFRPWSPNHQEKGTKALKDTHKDGIQGSQDILEIERTPIDHSKSQLICDTNLHKQQLTCYGSPTDVSKDTSCSRHPKRSSAFHPVQLPNKTLLQRLQSDYHNHHDMRIPPQDLNVHMVKDMSSEILRDQRYCVNNDILGSGGCTDKDPWCGVKCLQNRDIYNIPRPTLNIGNHASAFRRIRHSNYPLPTARDGEPLDLLPKSLYMNKANGGHLCIFCGKLYSRKYGLKIHLRTHTGYKPLRCKICQRPFGDPSNLNKHIRLHAEGDTPYRCGKCGKVLVRQRDLDRHIRARHPINMNHMASRERLHSPGYSEDGVSTSSCSSFEVETMEELDVVGLH